MRSQSGMMCMLHFHQKENPPMCIHQNVDQSLLKPCVQFFTKKMS
ncbi:unnamed protein product [Staurois parvus]|uniref:Uncharacterized protein n=1 Tax=Staurois parvus TaxID=386267 RepID=A0ABN9DJX2_9NEOB|nr:unnamed protein product [Staurois parvus]